MRYGFHDRLDHALKLRGISKAAASLAGGLNRDTLGKILSNRDSWPTIETVAKLAQGLQTTPEYLAYGIGRLDDASTAAKPPAHQPIGLPILGRVEAGIWVEAEAREDHDERLPVTPDPRFPAEAQYFLEPRGSSMNRIFVPGDYLHCIEVDRAGLVPREGDVVIIERRRSGGEVETSAKRLARINGRQAAVPDSTDERWSNVKLFLDEAEEDESIKITAVVIRVIRELRA